jgi:hypothetical protein
MGICAITDTRASILLYPAMQLCALRLPDDFEFLRFIGELIDTPVGLNRTRTFIYDTIDGPEGERTHAQNHHTIAQISAQKSLFSERADQILARLMQPSACSCLYDLIVIRSFPRTSKWESSDKT